MNQGAIHVQGLGKEYRIGQRERYSSLRDVIAGFFTRKSKTNESFWALRDVSFDVPQGEVLGLIGRNGAGKSTLLKVLSRITEPTQGFAELRGRVGSLLEVGTGFHPELTGRENIYLSAAILGMRRGEIQTKFDEIVQFAEVEKFLDTQVKHYSSGMFMRLAFSVVAHLQPEILLVDEVLAVGDASFQEKCLGKMHDIGGSGRTVVFVSHNMDSIRKLCTTALHIEQGRLKAKGPAGEIISNYEASLRADHSDGGIRFGAERNGFKIDRIDMLTLDGQAKPSIGTWDSVRFRVVYECPRTIRQGGAVVVMISTLGGAFLTFCATEPDTTFKVELKQGPGEIDLIFPRFMLSAGKYLISAALTITGAEWLVRSQEVVFEVEARDIFNSGFPPRAPRSMVAQDHRWEIVK
jgi:lipopolysaccharide transport system ATP-binding protein